MRIEGSRGAVERRPWEQMEGEPDRDFARFQYYLNLGTLRTVKEAARRAGLEKRNKPYHSGGRWADISRAWCWRERALAWDSEQRNLLALSERNMRLALRERRVEMIEDTLERVRATLDAARIDEADQQQARQWLGEMRRFLCDLLALQRQEYERGDYSNSELDPYNTAAITADDLRAAQRSMEEAEARNRANAEGTQGETARRLGRRLGRPVREPADLLVIQQGDEAASTALQTWREVRASSGLQFARVLNPTQKNFAGVVHLGQGLRKPAKFMHVALPACAEGIQFSEGIVGDRWVSKRLEGLEVLLLARYSGEGDPAWARAVPCVITVDAGCEEEALAAFTQAFWEAIGGGEEPEPALEEALCCTPAAQAYVRRWW